MEKITAEQALNLCSKAVGDDGLQIAHEIKTGISEAWLIGRCCLITRVERINNDLELVVVCSQGTGLVAAGDVLLEAAKKAGCKTVRFHTKRPAHTRLLKKFNFQELERVYQMVV